MTKELHAYTTSGLTLYAVLLNATGGVWNGSAFETVAGGSWTSYDIAMTEAAAGIYFGNMPAAVAGVYNYVVYERAGATPATTDTYKGNGWLQWDGSAEIVPVSQDVLEALLANIGAEVTVVSAVEGGMITVYANETWSFTVTDATLTLTDYEVLALVVKRTEEQEDDEALLYLRSDTGLVRIDGDAPISAANGTLSSTATSFTALVNMAETVDAAPRAYTYWLKGFDTTPNPDKAFTLVTGDFTVRRAGLRAIA